MLNPEKLDHEALATEYAELPSEQQAPFFIQKILPLLTTNKLNKEMVLVLGNTGAGKSSLINYLLNHQLESEDGIRITGVVANPKLPHAQIGTKASSCTLIPLLFSTPELPYSFCDNPGFGESRNDRAGTLKEMQQFSMAFVYEMAQRVKATIIVISKSEIGSARGAVSKSLFKAIKNLIGNGGVPANLLFVLNNEGDLRPIRFEYYSDAFKNEIRRLEKEQRDIEEIQLALKEQIINQRTNTSVWQTMVDSIKSRFSNQEEESLPSFYLQIIQDELDTIQATKELYSNITEANSIVWDTHTKPDCREAILAKLNHLPSEKLSKAAMQFEPSETLRGNFRKALLEWVKSEQGQLDEILNEKHQLLRSFSLNPVMTVPTIIGKLDSFYEKLGRYSNKLNGLKQECYFSDVVLKEDEQQGAWTFYVNASVTPYSFSDESGALVPFTQIYTKATKQQGLPSMLEGRVPSLKKISEKPGEETTRVSLEATYQSQYLWVRIPQQTIAEYWGCKLDHPTSKSKFLALVKKIESALSNIKELVQNPNCQYLAPFFMELVKTLAEMNTQGLTTPESIWRERHNCLAMFSDYIVKLTPILKNTIQQLSSSRQAEENPSSTTCQSEQERAYHEQVSEEADKQNTALAFLEHKLNTIKPHCDKLHETLRILQQMLEKTKSPTLSESGMSFFNRYEEAFASTLHQSSVGLSP